MWEIDGADYRVTELPLGYEADGANITFRAFNDTTILNCFFNVFNVSTGNFEVVHSNNVTITTTPSQGTYVQSTLASVFCFTVQHAHRCSTVRVTLFTSLASFKFDPCPSATKRISADAQP